MQHTPVTLLDKLRANPDEDCWKRLVDLYTPFLHHCCSQQGLQSAERDDVVQDVLAVVVREIPGFQHNRQPGAFRAWLRSIAVNRFRAYWRTRAPDRQAVGGESGYLGQIPDHRSNPEANWDREHDLFIVRRALELLEPEFTPKTWLAFRRQVVDDVIPDDVARELGMTSNAVILAKFRVLRRLKREVEGITD